MLPRLSSRLESTLFYVVSFGFLYLRSFRLPGTPYLATGDQVLFFTRAQRILQGQIIYRDFFDMVTPGTEWLHAAVLAMTGIHAWVPPLLTVALGMSYCVLITHLGGLLFVREARFLPAIVFLAMVANNALDLTHHWYSALLALAAVAVLAKDATRLRVSLAGALCGVATMFTQTQGLGALLGLGVFLWMERRRDLIALVMPYLLVVGTGLGICVARAGGYAVFYHLVLFPLRYMSSGDVNSPSTYLRQMPPVHRAADVLHVLPALFVYLSVPYVYLLVGIRVRRSWDDMPIVRRRLLLLLVAVGTGLFLGVATAPRLYRLSTVAAPAVLLAVWWMGRWPQCRAALVTLACAFFVLSPVRRQMKTAPLLDLPVGRVAIADAGLFAEYQWLQEHTHPGDGFFNEPGLGFYLALRNPTASEFVNYVAFTRPEQVNAILHRLQADPPRYIALTLTEHGIGLPGDHAGPFRDFVHAHYEEAARFTVDGATPYEEAIWRRRSEE